MFTSWFWKQIPRGIRFMIEADSNSLHEIDFKFSRRQIN